MSKALVTGAAQTSHDEMLGKTRDALAVLLADQETQQSSIDALLEIARRQEASLATHQSRRGELLAQLQVSQLAASKAEAARDLSIGTKSAHKREAAYEAAKSVVNDLHAEMLALSQADAEEKEAMQGTAAILEDAQHTLARIEERIGIAQSLVAEEEEVLRSEVAATYQSKTDSARAERDKLKTLLAAAEEKVQQAQSDQVEALKVWPQFAEQELSKTLEIAPSLGEQLLDTYLHFSDMIEHHSQSLVRADPAVLKALSMPCPVHVFSAAGSREAQRAAAKAAYKHPGIGLDPQLWHYNTHLGEVEQLRDRRRQEHRQAVIHSLVWGNQ